MHYFIQQNMNYFGADVELVDEEQGKEEVSKLDMAAKVGCGRMHSNKPSLAEIGQVIKGVSEALTSFNEGMQAIDRSPRPKTTSGYKPSTSGYKSSFGSTYEYDLSNPSDRVRYRADPKAKLRDRLDVNPQRRIERNIGQHGGGVLNKNKDNSPQWNWVD